VVTYYGHGSSIALLVFIALVALRAISSQRRRRGRPTVSSSASSYTDAPFPDRTDDGVGTTSDQVTFTGIPPGWLIDPSGRHEKRYWSGSEWTEHVSDGGVPGTDPPPGGPGREGTT
jgi:Protein of unknown function (DUF2510)